MGDVIDFGGPTLFDIPTDKILTGALEAKLVSCIVIGECANGEIYTATSTGDLAEIILALEMCKLEFLKQAMG